MTGAPVPVVTSSVLPHHPERRQPGGAAAPMTLALRLPEEEARD
jgi:hypothetical protein